MKYFVKQLPTYDTEIYYNIIKDDIESNYKNDIFIGFNADYNGFNFDLINVINNDLLDYSNYELEYYYKNNLCALIIDRIKEYKRINLKQAIKIASIIKDTTTQHGKRDILDILSIIFNKKYELYCMRGYSQSDWQYIIYSSDIHFKYIQYIEAVYFGCGLEIEIHDGDNIPTSADQIEGYTEYLACNMDVKKEIANLLNCIADDIVYYEITNEYKITKYEYTAR